MKVSYNLKAYLVAVDEPRDVGGGAGGRGGTITPQRVAHRVA